MKNKLAMTGLFAALILSVGQAGAAEDRRGFYLDVGLGAGNVKYGEQVDDALDLLEDNDFDRTTLSLDLTMGGAVLQNLYVVGSISGFADRFDDGDEDLQLNTYLFGVGVRYYPLASRKHLQLGLDAGLAKMVVQSSVDNDDFTSDTGSGFKVSLAWDFDSTLRGPHFLLGVQYTNASIDDVDFSGGSLFARFIFK